MRIEGRVSPGFESVKRLFELNFESGQERHAQLCVYVGAECVVDLWGSADNVIDEQFGPDSIINVFSSTKCVVSIIVAKLVEDGLLSYDGKVSDVWPEFGENGKSDLRLENILRHEAGLASLDTTIPLEDLTLERVKENAVGKVLEKQTSHYRSPSDWRRREYHAVTRGWILNEIVRRVDPKGRTIGQILRDDLAAPLNADVFLGLTPEVLQRVTPVKQISNKLLLKKCCIPEPVERKVYPNFIDMFELGYKWMKLLRGSSRHQLQHPPSLDGVRENGAQFFNREDVRKVEIPSANGHATARGLALLSTLMANDGSHGDFRYLTPSTVDSFHSEPIERLMSYCANFFVRGGVSLEKLPTSPSEDDRRGLDGLEGYYGWGGYGGSQMQWHREEKIAFAYVPSFLFWVDITNEKGRKMQREVLKCVKNIKNEVSLKCTLNLHRRSNSK